MNRRKTKEVKIGNVIIGGNHPIAVQGMTKTYTKNVKATVEQIKRLEEVGCEIVRVAVPDIESAKVLNKIKERINIPLVADIHFNYLLAIKSIEQGVDKIRINPGNIGDKEKVKAIIKVAKEKNISIRIGINIGSLEKKYENEKEKAKAMVDCAIDWIKFFEDQHFFNLVISLKASDVITTVDAYKELAKKVLYPFHIGITEAGTILTGSVKSAIGIGLLLASGIGDTIRVSLTAEPEEEIKVGYEILKSLGLREKGPIIISCPSCGRAQIDQISLANRIEKELYSFEKPIKVAVMGCVVNGPGEAKEADIGIAGGRKSAVIFKHGKVLRKVDEKNIVSELIREIKNM
jgi:(E)-4-hydroxy-3-methylbut-2-enyl-diphosphate synthase